MPAAFSSIYLDVWFRNWILLIFFSRMAGFSVVRHALEMNCWMNTAKLFHGACGFLFLRWRQWNYKLMMTRIPTYCLPLQSRLLSSCGMTHWPLWPYSQSKPYPPPPCLSKINWIPALQCWRWWFQPASSHTWKLWLKCLRTPKPVTPRMTAWRSL